jgi:DNA repair exonuclease SbcCD nuclease subunit
MKILHMADIHGRDKDLDEINRCMTTILNTARSEKVDLILIAGDIFDSQEIKAGSDTALFIIGCICILANIAPIAIVIGTPSHDGKAPQILSSVRGTHPVIVADKPMQVVMFNGNFYSTTEGCVPRDPHAVITLIPQPTKQYFNSQSGIQQSDLEIGQAMSALFAGYGASAAQYGCPHILIGHWNVTGAYLSNGQTLTGHEIEVSTDQMMLAKPDLICLGHIHKAQQLGCNTFYSGSIYRNNWGEMEPKGFYIHEVAPFGVYSTFIETPTRKLVRFTHDATSKTVGNWPRYASALFGNGSVAGAFVRCDFTVWQDEAGQINKTEIENISKNAGALDVDIRIIRVPRENIRAEAVIKAETLRDKIVKMAELRGEEVDSDILLKADLLESVPTEELLARIRGGENEIATQA